MSYLLMSLFALAIVAADQVTKYLTVAAIPLGGAKAFIPGFLRFTYVQNTGGAWSLLSDHTWILVVVSLLAFAMIFLAIYKKYVTGAGTLWSLFAVLGGGVGNLIDRLRLGYVVDMIETEFISFPVFNVADCFITCGAIGLCVFMILEEKKEKARRAAQAEDNKDAANNEEDPT